MKLNTKRTVLVGFAFLSICAFWQMYDNLIPLMLTNTFHVDETISGAIMAADNVLALFLLPLFGGLSDKCRSISAIVYKSLTNKPLQHLFCIHSLNSPAPHKPTGVGCTLLALGA